ncbi:hypothetical protein AA0521_2788 [Komagataeibacter intermedius NRIC 0521]|uniref:Uncharacterized protein n=1 Tax=Komagataeibacter intermedius NRIC 0521 TaxID=1307934 RepID=A0ABQ0PNC0_9PROT|nr:hypothetical protein AA0521_2788 [Komagataeibacter intermedius NRIC 0521]
MAMEMAEFRIDLPWVTFRRGNVDTVCPAQCGRTHQDNPQNGQDGQYGFHDHTGTLEYVGCTICAQRDQPVFRSCLYVSGRLGIVHVVDARRPSPWADGVRMMDLTRPP